MTTTFVVIAYSQKKWMCLLTSTWYHLSPSTDVCIFACLYFLLMVQLWPLSRNLELSGSTNPIEIISCSWGFVVLHFGAGWHTQQVCSGIAVLSDNATLLLLSKTLLMKRSPSQACSHGLSLPGNGSLWHWWSQWKRVGTRSLQTVGVTSKQGSLYVL